ncbi:multidrug efflux SMR transporter [Luteococcus sediminum]
MDPWIALAVAGVFEVGMTTCLQLEQRNKNWGWGFLACAVVSFNLLSTAIQTIPLGTAYAIWTGIGAVGTIGVDALLFGHRPRPATLSLMALAITLILMLKVAS